MKNKEYLKKYIFQSFIVIIIFSFVFIIIGKIEYQNYKQNFNYKINAIVETLQEEYPNVDKEKIIEVLNSKDSQENILKDYGYDIDKDSYILQNDADNLIFSIIKICLLLLSFFIFIYFFVRYTLKNDKEIDKIIKCIEDINHKNYELDLDELSEDKLSILKQEIYKTTIMLKENAENSMKDKIQFKKFITRYFSSIKNPINIYQYSTR